MVSKADLGAVAAAQDQGMQVAERQNLIKNLSWSTLATVMRIILAGGGLAVIGHIVTPAQMGLYGIGWVGASFGYTISLSGAAQGLIAIGILERQHIAAAQFLSMVISLTVVGALVIAAPFAAQFYGVPAYGHAVQLGALFVPLMSLGAVDIARAQKMLQFSRLAFVQTLAVLLATICALTLALCGFGLLALFALQGLIGFWAFVIFRFYQPSPGFGPVSWRHVKDIWEIGVHLSFGSLTGVIWQNLPQLIIGKIASVDEVGLFVFCNRIVQLVFAQLNGMINNVIYPTFVRLRDQPSEVGKAFLETIKITYFCLSLPLLVLAAGPEAFLAVYGGSQWISAGPLLFYLALMQLVLALGANVFPTFAALRRPSVAWQWNLFIGLVQGVGVLELARYGIIPAVRGLVLTALVMPLAVYWLSRSTGFSMYGYARNMTGVVVPLAPAIVVGHLIQTALVLAPLVELGLIAIAACSIYVGMTIGLDRRMRESVLWTVGRFARRSA